MKSRLFVADILVNGTGAMMVLLFLFIVRLSPQEHLAPPTSLNRPLMLIDIYSSEAVLTPVVPFSAYLANTISNAEAVPIAQKPFFFRKSPRSPDAGFGDWGVTPTADGMRLIVPCPETGSWALTLTYPTAASDLRDAIHEVVVRVRLLGDESASLNCNTSAALNTAECSRTLSLQFEKNQKMTWLSSLEANCDGS